MDVFNQHSRTRNVLTSSVVGLTCNLLTNVMGFVYRSIFLHFLSAAYLGLTGLFGDVLVILSLTDLGISSAISFRFYDPISRGDVQKVGQLLHFFRKVYLIIAGVILVLGLSAVPFLDFFIKDPGEVPQDINLRLIYMLCLLQSVSSYLFAYKQNLLVADQKQYLMSLFTTGTTLLRYIFQLSTLWIWKNYTLTLAVSILATLFCNILISFWIDRSYRAVFTRQTPLLKEEQSQILKDTKATMLHKIGSTVLFATDNIVLTKYVGLVVTGLYSNYSMIFTAITTMAQQALGSCTASLGNARMQLDAEAKYAVYRRLLFLNFWVAGVTATCLFGLANDFIELWVGPEMKLDLFVVSVLCVNFYIQNTRQITGSFSTASGLFIKDRLRPLLESALNLVISIVLVQRIGIAGVFLGTIFSALLTVFWREPYILYRYEFKTSTADYWKLYTAFAAVAVAANVAVHGMGNLFRITGNALLDWLIKAVACGLTYCVLATLAFCRSAEFRFYLELVLNFGKRLIRKKGQ